MLRHRFCDENHFQGVICIECEKRNEFDKFISSESQESKEFIKNTTIKMAIEKPELYKQIMENKND